jgi:cell division septum initiation protein DivIVA
MKREDERVAELEQLLAAADDEVQELQETNRDLRGRISDLERFINDFAESARRILGQNG